ncbi:MAG: hypothetical protein ABII00_00330, partial [Elusimicrobiota bacterium]
MDTSMSFPPLTLTLSPVGLIFTHNYFEHKGRWGFLRRFMMEASVVKVVSHIDISQTRHAAPKHF